MKRAAMIGAAALAAGLGAPATTQPVRTPDGAAIAARPSASPDALAAAQRLLTASRFRARQDVLADDGLAAVRQELADDCVSRAAAGTDLAGCNATGRPDARTRVALAKRRPGLLDAIMTASRGVYAAEFTPAEMDELTRFFQSPIGQKYSLAYPRILARMTVRRRAIMRRYLVAAYPRPSPAAPASDPRK